MNHYEEAVKGYLDVASNARDIKLEEKSLYNIGNAMYRQGKLEEAVDYYKKAIALEPEDKDAKQNLEFVLEEIKRRINEAKKTQEEQNQKQQEKQNQQEDNKTSEKEQTCQNGQKQEQGENQQGQQQQQEQQQGQQGQEQKQKQEQKQEQKQGNEQKEVDQNSQDKNKSSKDEPEQGGVKKEQEQAVTGEKSKEKGGDNATAYAKQMTKEEAEQWLNSAQESRDKFKKKNQAMKGTLPYSSDKDW
jgi:Ca-activated chloride channel family protein